LLVPRPWISEVVFITWPGMTGDDMPIVIGEASIGGEARICVWLL